MCMTPSLLTNERRSHGEQPRPLAHLAQADDIESADAKLSCGGGIASDCRQRMPYYLSDWSCTSPRFYKVLSATYYAYFM